MSLHQKQAKTNAYDFHKKPRPRHILGLCPIGLVLAFVAHVLQLLTSLLMLSHEHTYFLAAIGYATLSCILGQKVWRLRRHVGSHGKRGLENDDWENEYGSGVG